MPDSKDCNVYIVAIIKLCIIRLRLNQSSTSLEYKISQVIRDCEVGPILLSLLGIELRTWSC